MVLTVVQMTGVFKGNNQMGVPHATVMQFQLEGISGVDDLADFDKDSLKQLADNLHCLGGCIPDPNPAAVAGAIIPNASFHIRGQVTSKIVSGMQPCQVQQHCWT